MNVYLITYQLNQNSQTYIRIKETISFNFENKECLNVFIVKSDLTASKIHDVISPHIQFGEKLLILKLETGSYHDGSWNDVSSDTEEWLIEALR